MNLRESVYEFLIIEFCYDKKIENSLWINKSKTNIGLSIKNHNYIKFMFK